MYLLSVYHAAKGSTQNPDSRFVTVFEQPRTFSQLKSFRSEVESHLGSQSNAMAASWGETSSDDSLDSSDSEGDTLDLRVDSVPAMEEKQSASIFSIGRSMAAPSTFLVR